MTSLRSRVKLTPMSRNKEEKIYTYVVLAIGFFIWIFYFYHGYRSYGFLTTEISHTEYSFFFDDIFNGIFDNTFSWLILQVLFLYSWWSLRDCIVSVLKRIHNKI